MFSTIAAPPPKQSVSDAIAVFSSRLASSTLLEDRRSAIQGLRSVAKQYPASVASGALRGLIASLSKDGEDVDTVKLVLETLLMLFSPDPDSPEASDEIPLWMADEFTQRQENITLLLDFLDTPDFYSRLYSLQLLAAILSARTARTEECIHVAPLGVDRLVAVLDDKREAVRDEAISLLTDLTPTSVDLQTLVAFNGALRRVFGIIIDEGGLAEGARVVEDCLILLANLLRLNPSNQKDFRTEGYFGALSHLLESVYKTPDDGHELAQWAAAQRNRNLYALLAVIRLFLVPGTAGIEQNQMAFFDKGVLGNTLQLAFKHGVDLPIQSEALVACADMIRGNPALQERFAGLQVPSRSASPAAGQVNGNGGGPRDFVIDGLLVLILTEDAPQAFDLRMAACTCLKAYIYDHPEIRRHFLARAIGLHDNYLQRLKEEREPSPQEDKDERTNILTTLLTYPNKAVLDPYRYWFAAVIMLHLIHENPETKALAMAVSEGDEAEGEDVVTCIQGVTAHLLSSVENSEDPRVSVGYLMLLLSWLHEDLAAVNDFLAEGTTNVRRLIQAAVENPHGDVMVQGLSATLLGVIYEFSTRDSPMPRALVRDMIASRMGRDRYADKLAKLRAFPLMRDHEMLPQRLPDQQSAAAQAGEKLLPDVFFDDAFVDFFKDNYRRVLAAIDREPDLETSVLVNGAQAGVSRELVDDLRAQLAEQARAAHEAEAAREALAAQLAQEQSGLQQQVQAGAQAQAALNEQLGQLRRELGAKTQALQLAEAKGQTAARELAQERTDHQRTRQEVVRLRSVNDGLQRNHEDEMVRLRRDQAAREDEAKRLVETTGKAARQEAERVQRRAEAEKADLKATISRLEVDLMRDKKEIKELGARAKKLEEEVERAARERDAAGREVKEVKEREARAVESLRGVERELEEALESFAETEGELQQVRARSL